MKENVKIFLLGVIALASVVNIFMLSNLGKAREATEETTTSAAVASNVSQQQGNQAFDPTAPNPNVPAGVEYVDEKIVPLPTDMKKTSVSWGNMVHDFGKVKQNTENKYSFSFTNTGKEPLLITNAVGSCGCTVPDYPKEPVAPGASATINVVYKPGTQEKQQEKTVTVTANTEPMQTTLKIRAFVEK